MTRPSSPLRLTLAALTLALGLSAAASADDAAAAAENNNGAFHTVEAGPFSVAVELEGVVEAADAWPLRLELEQFSSGSLELLEGVEQGEHVAAGDTLLRFDPEPLERQIADQRLSLEVTEAGIERAQQDLAFSESGHELDLASARRAAERAEEDYERWDETDRALDRQGAEMSLASAQQRLENAREELEQLQAMYRDEDLTEESEEIVLRRQQHEVRVAEFALKRAEARYDRTLSVDLPRREEDLTQSIAATQRSLEREQTLTPQQLAESRLSLEKRQHDRVEAARRLEQLEGDLERLQLTAPADGVVYYGAVDRGQWSGGESVAQSIREGGSFSANSVILTVVDPDTLRVRASVPESTLYRFEDVGELAGYVTLTGFPGRTMRAEAESLEHISGSEHDVLIAFNREAAPAALRPGMNASVHLNAYETDEAITVPLSAIRHAADGSPYVERRTEDDQTQRQPVTLGWRSDEQVEITEGLDAGDQIKLQP